MILGRVVGSSHRARKGLGVGSSPNPSLEIKEKAGGWCWVASRLSPGDWGLGEGLTKASTLTDLGWWQSASPASPFGYEWPGLNPEGSAPDTVNIFWYF